jgi:hypothetical protein
MVLDPSGSCVLRRLRPDGQPSWELICWVNATASTSALLTRRVSDEDGHNYPVQNEL